MRLTSLWAGTQCSVLIIVFRPIPKPMLKKNINIAITMNVGIIIISRPRGLVGVAVEKQEGIADATKAVDDIISMVGAILNRIVRLSYNASCNGEIHFLFNS